MNKRTTVIILAAIAILVIAGVVVAMTMNGDKESGTDRSSTQSSSDDARVDPSKEFNPRTLDNVSYVATSTSTVDGKVMKSSTESDGKGTMKTSSSFEGVNSESYVTGDTVITCINGECTKATVDTSAEEQTSVAQDINQYKESAQYIGTETCPAGTCQVWKANGPVGEVSYYIDSQNRISKIRMSEGGTETTYEYKDVSIVLPAV